MGLTHVLWIRIIRGEAFESVETETWRGSGLCFAMGKMVPFKRLKGGNGGIPKSSIYRWLMVVDIR